MQICSNLDMENLSFRKLLDADDSSTVVQKTFPARNCLFRYLFIMVWKIFPAYKCLLQNTRSTVVWKPFPYWKYAWNCPLQNTRSIMAWKTFPAGNCLLRIFDPPLYGKPFLIENTLENALCRVRVPPCNGNPFPLETASFRYSIHLSMSNLSLLKIRLKYLLQNMRPPWYGNPSPLKNTLCRYAFHLGKDSLFRWKLPSRYAAIVIWETFFAGIGLT